jgi:hypothetical protein
MHASMDNNRHNSIGKHEDPRGVLMFAYGVVKIV